MAQVTIAVPVFDAFDATRRCLEALARHTSPAHSIVLVDDGSTDPRIAPLLRGFAAARAGVEVRQQETNRGFVATVNSVIAATRDDLVILNSDTRVTEGWLEALLRCRDSSAAIGLACPLSNNATILTIPGIEALLVGEDGMPDVDAIGACVRGAARRIYPRIPTAVGFCMLVTRALLDRAGALDRVYGRGYGEECDLSMRAWALGFEVACCDDAYVHHDGGASFGALRGVHAERDMGQVVLERRWPGYRAAVMAWARANPLRATLERINAAAERARFPGRPRVLQVVHRLESRGGIEELTRHLVNRLKEDAVFTIVHPAEHGQWSDYAVERLAPHVRLARLDASIARPRLSVIGHPADVRDEGVEGAFAALLCGSYDVVHFHSLVGWNSLRLPQLARAAGSRVVVSLHDFSFLCADYNMMTGVADRPCGRVIAAGGDAGCIECLRGKSLATPTTDGAPSIAAYLDARGGMAAEALAAADVIVSPSRFTAERHARAFAAARGERVRLIGHGVGEMPLIHEVGESPILRVAVLGRFTARKGSGVVVEAARRLAGQRVAFESWGNVDALLVEAGNAAGIVFRGPYAPADLPRILRGVDLVVVPSIYEETFCLTLSEAQRLGIPVAASAAGAMPERIVEGETGFLVPPGDAAALVKLLLRLRDDRPALAHVAARLREQRPKGVAENAREYLALYRELAALPASPPAQAPEDAALATRLLQRRAVRARTELGAEEYDRWLASQPSVSPAAAGTPMRVLVMPGTLRDGRTARSALAQVAPGSVETLADFADPLDALRALNRAVADAPEPWVVLVEDGDTLAADALCRLGTALEAAPRAWLAYADDDATSERGERYDPVLKPAFSPWLLRSTPYLAGICAVRRDALLSLGGFRAAGWDGVVELARRVAAAGEHARVLALRGILVHRLDTNVRPLASAGRSTEHPAPASAVGTLSAFVWGCREAADDAAICIESLLRAMGPRLRNVLVDLDAAQGEQLARRLDARGVRPTLGLMGGTVGALGTALARAGSDWLLVVDARCADFRPGWLDHASAAMAQDHVAVIAGSVAQGDVISPGWEVVGGGAWSIAGPPPAADGLTRLEELARCAREVGAASGRFALVRRLAALANVSAPDLAAAGRYAFTHLCLALRQAGMDIVSMDGVAAGYSGPLHEPVPRALGAPGVPPDVRWMRERWGAGLEEDPYFHPALALGAARLAPRPAFPPRPRGTAAVPRVCAFPFDRWGSGALRVRQPMAALERTGRAHVLVMADHDSGRAPNALEWRRLGADALLAHNFLHDYQLQALEEYARHSPALRVIGFDDLLTALPAGNPFAATIYPDVARRIERAVALCDRLVVSTAALADAYGAGAPDVRVIPNALDETAWHGLANRPRGGERPRVGWAGARQHAGDLRLLEPVVRATWREVDWVFLGMCPEAIRPMAAEVHPMVPLAGYPAKLASLGLDAAVAPLEDVPFNRAKSWLKVLEYGVLGIPAVASDLAPYRDTPATRVGPAPDDWIDALRALIADRNACAAAGARLREFVLSRGMLGGTIGNWSDALAPTREIGSRNQEDVEVAAWARSHA